MGPAAGPAARSAPPPAGMGQASPRRTPLRRTLLSWAGRFLAEYYPEPAAPLDVAGIGGVLRWFYPGRLGLCPPAVERMLAESADGAMELRMPAPSVSPSVLWRVPRRLWQMRSEDPAANWERLLADWQREAAALDRLEGMDTAGLARLVRDGLASFDRYGPRRIDEVFLSGLVHETIVRLLARRAVGPHDAAGTVRDLLGAVPHRTARLQLALTGLAHTAGTQGRDSPGFAAAVEDFLADWGDRSTGGMPPLVGWPTWREDPIAVIGLVDALAGTALDDGTAPDDGAASHDGTARAGRERAAYLAARSRIVGRLGPLWRRRFLASLRRSRGWVFAREDGLFWQENVAARVRRAALRLGDRLVASGVLAAPDDVFFLLPDELLPAADGRLDTRDRVARRRAALDRVRAAQARGEHWVPAALGLPAGAPAGTGGGQDDHGARPGARPGGGRLGGARPGEGRSGGGRKLTGLPASHGRATGPARVVRGPAEFGRLRRGDVLVAPLTSPAWTPLFGIAAAVVTDAGGPLSHAAIVAREYGIPAVLGTGEATVRLVDGEHVTVDGDAGVVTTDPAGPAAP